MPAKSGLTTVLAAALLTCCISSARARSIDYRPWKMFHGGYSEKQVAPNRWRVTGSSLSGGAGPALPVAVYRGALLLKRAGFPYMQIVKSQLEVFGGTFVSNQLAKIHVVGVRTADAPVACENKKRNLHLCRTVSVADTIRLAGAELGHTPTEIAEDYAEVERGTR